MYKKLAVFVGLIIVFVVLTSLIGIRMFSDADTVEGQQARALGVLKNIERIDSQITEVETGGYAVLLARGSNEKTFWGTFDELKLLIDNQASAIHSGDCKTCHKAFISLKPELGLLQKNLAQLDKARLSDDSSAHRYQRAVNQNMQNLKRISAKIDTLTKDELRRARAEIKASSAQQPGAKAHVPRRLARDLELKQRATSLIITVHELDLAIKNDSAGKAQASYNRLSELAKSKPVEPPLKGNCYSCHHEIAQLPEITKKIKNTMNKLVVAKRESRFDAQALHRFKTSFTKPERSMAKILDLARADAARSMQQDKQVRTRLKAFMFALALCVILFSLAGAALVTTWVRKRVAVFSKAIDAISNGDYTYIVDMTARDEVADLAHAFNLMVGKIRSTQDELTHVNNKLRELHLNTVKALVEAIEAKDPYTRGHSENVAKYTLLIGQELGLSVDELDELHVAALLHDIGKIGVREEILNKTGPLTDSEYDHIKIHPALSAQIVGRIPNLARAASIIRHHHEHFNGTGYSDGLAGEDIPIGSRILAVADAFDAMTSDRPYRAGCSFETALSEMKACSGEQFDPLLVEALLRAMNHHDSKEDADVRSA
ncbi:MAG TPA: HD domain-containing phosphohydrolase [Candidatus Aquicultor sp.]|jgi:HD-GYP domain-containing protein (c-di-GMP phosphodiesterase class II)